MARTSWDGWIQSDQWFVILQLPASSISIEIKPLTHNLLYEQYRRTDLNEISAVPSSTVHVSTRLDECFPWSVWYNLIHCRNTVATLSLESFLDSRNLWFVLWVVRNFKYMRLQNGHLDVEGMCHSVWWFPEWFTRTCHYIDGKKQILASLSVSLSPPSPPLQRLVSIAGMLNALRSYQEVWFIEPGDCTDFQSLISCMQAAVYITRLASGNAERGWWFQ
jgi:hypothetical protein